MYSIDNDIPITTKHDVLSAKEAVYYLQDKYEIIISPHTLTKYKDKGPKRTIIYNNRNMSFFTKADLDIWAINKKKGVVMASAEKGTADLPGIVTKEAEPGEPEFNLLGRDPVAPNIVRMWAAIREADYKQAALEYFQLVSIAEGYYENNPTEEEQISNACRIASEMETWRNVNR